MHSVQEISPRVNVLKNQTKSNFFGKARKIKFACHLPLVSP